MSGGCKAGGTSTTCTQVPNTKWINTLALIITTSSISEHNYSLLMRLGSEKATNKNPHLRVKLMRLSREQQGQI